MQQILFWTFAGMNEVKRMRKMLMVLGALTLGTIVLAGATLLLFYPKGDQLDQESKAYVDATMPVIFNSWDSHAYLEQASPELLAVAPPVASSPSLRRFPPG